VTEQAREAARRLVDSEDFREWASGVAHDQVLEDVVAAALDRYAEAHLSAWRAARRDPADGGPLLCDLCQEPAQEWRWVDEGWSLACLPCIAKVAEARVAEAVGAALTMDDAAAGRWWWQSTAMAAKWPETEAWDLMPQPMKNVFIHHGQAALADLRQRAKAARSAPSVRPSGNDAGGA
jgi:hypothetical protein